MQSTKADQMSFTRKEFYDKIWSIPSEKFAADLGISDALLRRVCQEYRIPKPYPGYWSKRRNGQSPHQTELPVTSVPRLQTLTFQIKRLSLSAFKPSLSEYDDDIRRLLDTANSLPRLVVPDTLTDPHPLVAETGAALSEDWPEPINPPSRRAKSSGHFLDISVSPPQLDRALRIMDAIVRRVEAIGGCIKLRPQRKYDSRISTLIVFAKEPIAAIRVREICKRYKVPPPNSVHWNLRARDMFPTGLLAIDHGTRSGDAAHLKERAGKGRLEDALHDWIIRLIHDTAALRYRQCEEAEQLRLETERRREQAARDKLERTQLRRFKARQKEARDRLDALVTDATSWRKSQLIREYVDAFEATLKTGKCLLPMGHSPEEYLAWARSEADLLDPFVFSPPSIHEEVFIPIHDAPTE
jgi:hypothetical protein